MTTATKTEINNTTVRALNYAQEALTNNYVRIHRDAALPTVNFSKTFTAKNTGVNSRKASFADVVFNAADQTDGNFGRAFSVSIAGLLGLALTNCDAKASITVGELQDNGSSAEDWFDSYGISAETLVRIDHAFYPWTTREDITDHDLLACMNFQRRMRKGNTNADYANLAYQIISNIKRNNGEFRPAREDYRAIA